MKQRPIKPFSFPRDKSKLDKQFRRSMQQLVTTLLQATTAQSPVTPLKQNPLKKNATP